MEGKFKFKTQKEQFIDLLSDKISVSPLDLSENEKILIEESYEIFKYKEEEIKLLNADLKRINLELLNLKSMID
ncbi:hypothetical protein M0Q50_07615 [bacterium]|jgi:hypothetical protein|nr:hypothetical protein [bacterium]